MSVDAERFVFDTNVLVSALLFSRSTPRRALDRARSAGRLLVSDATLAELEDVLSRRKLDRYAHEDVRMEFFEQIEATVVRVELARLVKASRDPSDDNFLEVAVNGGARWIVSCDADLLDLDPFEDVHIVSPSTLLRELGPQSGT